MSAVALLRNELSYRAAKFAASRSLPHCVSYGEDRIVCFEALGDRRHGNFHPASFRAIEGNAQWRRRLDKVHTTAKSLLPRGETGRRRELDSCMSSDALLMNVFCHPGVLRSVRVAQILGVEPALEPQFGYRACVPLVQGRFDRTEVDMLVGDLLVEAKLTENNFQRVAKARLKNYRDFLSVFDEEFLPQTGGHYDSYQLIRNVLAAYDRRCSFCVLLDARRPDLIEAWYAVMRCVKPVVLRTACKVLTWQELSHVLPTPLRDLLVEKYGIE